MRHHRDAYNDHRRRSMYSCGSDSSEVTTIGKRSTGSWNDRTRLWQPRAGVLLSDCPCRCQRQSQRCLTSCIRYCARWQCPRLGCETLRADRSPRHNRRLRHLRTRASVCRDGDGAGARGLMCVSSLVGRSSDDRGTASGFRLGVSGAATGLCALAGCLPTSTAAHGRDHRRRPLRHFPGMCACESLRWEIDGMCLGHRRRLSRQVASLCNGMVVMMMESLGSRDCLLPFGI